jgi:hypothetical protein
MNAGPIGRSIRTAAVPLPHRCAEQVRPGVTRWPDRSAEDLLSIAGWRKLLTLLVLLAPLHAELVSMRRAATRGEYNGEGKCTIAVEVSGVAEIDVQGEMGRIRTLSGHASLWRRFDCNVPMPRDPAVFHITAIDGRGEVELLNPPRQNGGRAVVRITDHQDGRGVYSFDLVWQGGSAKAPATWDPGPPAADPVRGGRAPEMVQRACMDAVRARALADFHLRELEFHAVQYDARQSTNDGVIGNFDTHQNGNRERYNFSCRVDIASGRIHDVAVGPMATTRVPGPSPREDPMEFGTRAIAACRAAVEKKMGQDGYSEVEVRSAAPDVRHASAERVLGRVSAARGGHNELFDYYCSVEFSSGKLWGVRLDKR